MNLPISADSFDGHNFTLTKHLVWQMLDGKILRGIIGGTSDGASTPRATWSATPPFGQYWAAAYAHDLSYRGQTEELASGRWDDPDAVWRRVQLPKDYCDAMLLELMQSLGVDEIEAKTIYLAVKYGGNNAFSGDLAMPILK